jgi:hypothetical protein
MQERAQRYRKFNVPALVDAAIDAVGGSVSSCKSRSNNLDCSDTMRLKSDLPLHRYENS